MTVKSTSKVESVKWAILLLSTVVCTYVSSVLWFVIRHVINYVITELNFMFTNMLHFHLYTFDWLTSCSTKCEWIWVNPSSMHTITRYTFHCHTVAAHIS